MEADGHEHRGKTLFLEAFQGDVLAEGDIGLDFHAHGLDGFDLFGQNIPGQAVFGNAHGHHAAGHGQFFKNRDPVSPEPQKIGGGKPRRAGTDNGDFFSSGFGDFRHMDGVFAPLPIRQEPVEFPDGQGVVVIAPGADAFAGMVADPAADARKRVVLLEEFDGFRVFALVDQGDISLDADMGRAGGLARGGAPFADGKGPGDGLGVFFIDGFSDGKAPVLLVRDFNGTDFGAFAAAGAFGKIYKPGFLADFGLEMARFAVQGENFRSGFELNVQVPADLDQFGRDDSHGAVVGGKGLVQLGHEAPDGRGLFYQVHIISGIGEINRRLHARDAGPDHHGRADGPVCPFSGGLDVLIHSALPMI